MDRRFLALEIKEIKDGETTIRGGPNCEKYKKTSAGPGKK